MAQFFGRRLELAALTKRLERVRRGGVGEAISIRGRRQVGKSRLVQEFCDRGEVPYVFWAATKGASPATAVTDFLTELGASTLVANADAVPRVQAGSWLDAFRVLATALPDSPSIVVLDEIPWLSEQDEMFDGALQTVWDRQLSAKPVVLVLLGSDVHMMERFTSYDRPFYGRSSAMRLNPLNPAEVAGVAGLRGSAALDAHLITGGLPGLVRDWEGGIDPMAYLERQCQDPAAPIFTVPETALLAEFPAPDQTRRVLEAIGSGERTHANIAAAAGGLDVPLASGALSPILKRLVGTKRVVASDEPLSTQPGRTTLYRVADSNMRLYLWSLRHAYQEVQRGRPDMAFKLIRRGWEPWRGKAIEPLIREAVRFAILDGELPWEAAEAVGGWWNRQFNPEIDLVGGDREPVAKRLYFAGSIKWLNSRFDNHDLSGLTRAVRQLPGFDADSDLMVVSLSGVDERVDRARIKAVWGPEEVLAAWTV